MFKSETGDFGRGYALWYTQCEGQKKLHFSAANGFPVGSYKSFLALLAKNYGLLALENRGAWPGQPSPPKHFKWADHADDLIAFLERQTPVEPVIGVGHSIGGTLTLLASIKRPDLFSKLILIEPASFPNKFPAFIYRALMRLSGDNSLIAKTLRRRAIWESREHFRDYLPTKAVYKNFIEQAVNDYANEGLIERADGNLELRYQVEWEAHNFRKVLSIWRMLPKVSVPTLLILAEDSELYSKDAVVSQQNRFSENIEFSMLEGVGHLAPHEDPQQVAELIKNWLG